MAARSTCPPPRLRLRRSPASVFEARRRSVEVGIAVDGEGQTYTAVYTQDRDLTADGEGTGVYRGIRLDCDRTDSAQSHPVLQPSERLWPVRVPEPSSGKHTETEHHAFLSSRRVHRPARVHNLVG